MFNTFSGLIHFLSTLCLSYRGESYAGIYVPTLVHTVMKENDNQPADKQLNLKGFAVGIGEAPFKATC